MNPILACTIPSLKNLIAAIPEWIWANLLRYIRIFMYVWGGIIFLGLMISVIFNFNNGYFSWDMEKNAVIYHQQLDSSYLLLLLL